MRTIINDLRALATHPVAVMTKWLNVGDPVGAALGDGHNVILF